MFAQVNVHFAVKRFFFPPQTRAMPQQNVQNRLRGDSSLHFAVAEKNTRLKKRSLCLSGKQEAFETENKYHLSNSPEIACS